MSTKELGGLGSVRLARCYAWQMRLGWVAAAAFVAGILIGCHSPYVNAVVSNHTGEPVSVVEVDYPSASFGTDRLAPGADFRYRFKVQGSANMKLLWTDAQHKDHAATGPVLNEGAEGSYAIVIRANGVDWLPELKNK